MEIITTTLTSLFFIAIMTVLVITTVKRDCKIQDLEAEITELKKEIDYKKGLMRRYNLAQADSAGKGFDAKLVKWQIHVVFYDMAIFLYFDTERECIDEFERISSFSGFIEIDEKKKDISYKIMHT